MDLSSNGSASFAESANASPQSDAPSNPIQRLGTPRSASSSSLRQKQASITSDDQSLTSFPSLSPSLENSPEVAKDLDQAPTTPRGNDTSSFLSRPAASSYDRLFTPTPAAIERSALFEDTPKHTREIPGTLNLQNDSNVEHLLARTGAVALVKQMAEDLAQRDAQVTLLQRRAEERERLLKRMLRECEISNLDIEDRLRELELSKHNSSDTGIGSSSGQNYRSNTLGTEPNASMEDRVTLALADAFDAKAGSEVNATRTSAEWDPGRGRTVRGPSTSKTGTVRGWKDYFRPPPATTRQMSATQALTRAQQRNPSYTNATRPSAAPKRLDADAFKAPAPALSRTGSVASSLGPDYDQTRSRQLSVAGSDSVASSRSVAAWALRLVAGNVQGDRNNAAEQTNGTQRKTLTSVSSVPDMNARNATARRLNATQVKLPRSSFSSIYHSNGNPSKAQSESSRGSIKDMIAPNTPPESVDGAETNLGPVEMDTILPQGTRPPTLGQNTHNASSSEFLTDSFGFIYDQRRRRRQNEAAAMLLKNQQSNQVEILHHHRRSLGSADVDEDMLSIDSQGGLTRTTSRPETSSSATSKGHTDQPKRWQDYLKLSNLSTELLSHTPSAGPITDITTADPEEPKPQDKHLHLHMSKHGSVPALGQIPPLSASRVVSDNAELVAPMTSNPTSPSADSENEVDPVKALVEHLTEVHAAAQRDKAVKWNDFLRKVRVDRRRDITSKTANENRSRGSPMPETLLADGEIIGVAGLGVKGKVGRAKANEFRNLILAGIPTAYRSKIWAEGSGAVDLRVPGYYEELINSEFTDEAIVQQIQMDITRTLTDNIYYRRGAGVDKLSEVLLAYARRNPEIGYCQGMNLITANLLLIMPTAEDAFWVLTSMIENILPEKYYDSSLLTSRADQVVLRQYVSEILPQLSAHLENLGIELEALTFQWFLSVFTDCLSAEALFRVWDVVLCMSEGATFLFQVALALLKLNEKSLLKCESPAEVYGYINQGMTDHAISIDNLIRASEGLKKEVRTEEILKRRRQAVAREVETARQREAIRKGKGKARVAGPPPESQVSYSLTGGHSQQKQGRLTAADDIARGRAGKLTRRESRSEFDEETRQAFGELEVKTPMPIDEEAMWRG